MFFLSPILEAYPTNYPFEKLIIEDILYGFDEGDLELGRVSELEFSLPAPAGRIKCVSLQVLMITITYPEKCR